MKINIRINHNLIIALKLVITVVSGFQFVTQVIRHGETAYLIYWGTTALYWGLSFLSSFEKHEEKETNPARKEIGEEPVEAESLE